ncbi:YdcF family protein [Maritimibacter sp. UBA3975]|uniref:YdcF family protein n=1 Tax=Maritimibacter sp. UBA3975 TaxID=1946833 RepID=UPI0025BA5122|nr:YdcF family protein [Maritimibacter sp. UBA3975]
MSAVVMGAAVWPDGVPSPALRRRAETAGRLFLAGQAERIVATGAVGEHPPSEAEASAKILTGMGVPSDRILLENLSTSTLENLVQTRRLLGPRARVVIVTDSWHLPRALLTARRLGLDASGVTTPLRGGNPWRITKAVIREVPALFWYALRRLPRDNLS